jgi:hypothetical protein
MNFDIREIKYGSPNIVQQELLKEETYLDSLLGEILKYPPPKVLADIKDELEYIVKAINSTMNDEEAERRYIAWDKGFVSYFKGKMIESTDEENKKKIVTTVENIIKDTLPLLLKIKFHYNRPRPSQLAVYFDIPLYKYPSLSDNSPSYISGHVFQSKIICEVLGNHYPDSYKLFSQIQKDIAFSRIGLGLHYPSDVEVAEFCANKVLKNKEFMLKYKI